MTKVIRVGGVELSLLSSFPDEAEEIESRKVVKERVRKASRGAKNITLFVMCLFH